MMLKLPLTQHYGTTEMGTRHLICVKIDGEYKVAQYGQWDGYLSGQGAKVLRFLKDRRGNYNNFKKKVRLCSFMSDADIEAFNDKIDDNGYMTYETVNGEMVRDLWTIAYPELSRDAGSKILSYILHSQGLFLNNSINFSWEIGCEYGYVIDFDDNTFSVYTCGNKFVDGTRFDSFKDETSKYNRSKPISLVKEWSLDELPSKREFLSLESVLYNS